MLLFAIAAFAQGSIEGTITDAKGKGVANVSVTVVGANGKAVATVKTDADGAYMFENIAAGKYKIAAYGAPGLDSAFNENVIVEDNDATTVDLTLAAENPNGGKTQTKTDWPTVKYSFEIQYSVGGKTYKFFAQEITGLSAESDPIEYKPPQPADDSTGKGPGIKKYGAVTVRKGLFKSDKVFWDKFRELPNTVRGTITIRLLDEHSGTAMSWTLANANISKLVGNADAIESMTIAHEGLSLH